VWLKVKSDEVSNLGRDTVHIIGNWFELSSMVAYNKLAWRNIVHAVTYTLYVILISRLSSGNKSGDSQ